MARTESDKEDLIAEATALVERAEYVPAGESDGPVITAGFRRDQSLVVYFDQDPFYQFDEQGLLRRAFANGYLFRSQGHTLAQLKRERTETQTTLRRTDLDADALEAFRLTMRQQLERLIHQLRSEQLQAGRCVPENVDLRDRVISFLSCVLDHDTPFLSRTIRYRA